MNRSPGDLQTIRSQLIIIVVGAMIGAGVMTLATRSRPEFEAWIREDVGIRARMVAAAMIALTSGPLMLMSAYLWRSSNRPRIIRPLAILLGGSAIALALLLWRVISMLTNGRT